MKDTKIIANYLPQYHEIPENNMWWGKGYTDWNATKKATPLFKGHIQPKVPEDENYYDLSNIENIRWQAELAREYGVYGFGIYHYWFSSDLKLLQKPAELILGDKSIDINYMFIWDNASWKRTWSNVKGGNDWAPLYEDKNQTNSGNGLLAELIYGDESEWKKHFDYLLPFFLDSRYIRTEEGKPLFMFFNMDKDMDVLIKMTSYWNQLAVEAGLPGLAFAGKTNYHKISIFDYEVDYEPGQHGWAYNSFIKKVFARALFELQKKIKTPHILNYDRIWKRIIRHVAKCNDKKHLFSAFVNYDDTPRRGKNGRIVMGGTPEKFKAYMKEFISISRRKNKEFAFITAWNEWGEGAYLEPDNIYGKSYLKALKTAIDKEEK